LTDQLSSRLTHAADSEVRDALQGLLSSIFGPGATLERKERVDKKNKDAAASKATTSSSALSLKEQLEARLYHDPSVEVHDTIRAILASLTTGQSSEAAHASASSPKGAKRRGDAPATSSSSVPVAEAKGKGKVVSFDVPTATVPTSKDVVDSMNAIHNIQAAFSTLSADFSFPTRLDFTPPSSAPSSPHGSDSESVSTSQLAFTSTNAPVRYYEQALSALLSQLDAVESWGNEEVRKQRKEIVARVEAALEEVEKEVQERFVHRQARKARSESVEVEVAKVEGKGQSVELPAYEVVQAAVPALAEEPATVGVEAADAPAAVENVSAPAKQQPSAHETILTIDPETTASSNPSDEGVADLSEESGSKINDIPVSTSDEVLASPSEVPESEEPSLSATLNFADGNLLDTSGNAAVSSYPPISQIRGISSDAEQASDDTSTTQEESEAVDTFLLPAATESPVIKRPAVHEEDELVVIDKEHGEASDGENWLEVEA
jgi:hypothetical protein